VAADTAFLSFDAADLTAAPALGSRCVAVAGRLPARR
jgi:hypothetical protein